MSSDPTESDETPRFLTNNVKLGEGKGKPTSPPPYLSPNPKTRPTNTRTQGLLSPLADPVGKGLNKVTSPVGNTIGKGLGQGKVGEHNDAPKEQESVGGKEQTGQNPLGL